MDFRQLSRFLAVVDTGSFNRAADLLAVSQPSLSRSIQQLEASLGGPLFDRGAGGAVPTSMATELLPHARIILKDRERALEAIGQFRGGEGEVLELGCDAAFAVGRLPQALARLSAARPAIQTRVREGSMNDLLDLLREGSLSMVLGPRAPFVDLDNLSFQAVAVDSASALIRADHPALSEGQTATLQTLASLPWIVPDNNVLLEGWRQIFEGVGLPIPDIGLRTSSLALTRGCLLTGDFVSVGDYTTFAQEIEAGKVLQVELGPQRYERPVGIFHRLDARSTPGEKALALILKEQG